MMRQIPLIFVIFLSTILFHIFIAKDLYKLLGVPKTASNSEIKRAYRKKARETHPDKQSGRGGGGGEDPMVSSMAFREIVEAYEILTDKQSRQQYDLTGDTNTQKSTNRDNNRHNGNEWNWNFNFNFNFGHQNRRTAGHRYLYDPLRRYQILDAQSRVVNIRSLRQLIDAISVEDEEDDENEREAINNHHTHTTTTERYTLIALYDDSISDCTNLLQYQILYPWPFAGFSSEGNTDGSMWWEDVMITTKINFNEIGRKFKRQLRKIFDIPERKSDFSCPSFALIPRGESIDFLKQLEKDSSSSGSGDNDQEEHKLSEDNLLSGKKYAIKSFTDSDTFRSYVWQQLKVTVTFVNRSPWVVHNWWLDGTFGRRQEDIPAGHRQTVNTFLSHNFYFRAEHVLGNRLTNEVEFNYYFYYLWQ